jgi:hypothetical protein
MERRRNATSSLFEKNRNVAVLIFNDMDEDKVKELVNRLPLKRKGKVLNIYILLNSFEFN